MAKKVNAQKMSREAEQQFLASNIPSFIGARQGAFDWMNPANNPAMLERYRRSVMSAAGLAGQQGANMVAWGGGGSGAQQAMQNSALMQGMGQVGGFARNQLSPEYTMQQFGGLRAIMDPFMDRTEKELSMLGKQAQAVKAGYSGGGGLGGFLGQVGNLAAQFMPMGSRAPSTPQYLPSGSPSNAGWMGGLGNAVGGLNTMMANQMALPGTQMMMPGSLYDYGWLR